MKRSIVTNRVFATTSATDVVASELTQALPKGIYLVIASSNVRNSNTALDIVPMFISIYSNGVQVPFSERDIAYTSKMVNASAFNSTLVCQALVEINTPGTVVDARVRTSSGTMTLEERSIFYIKMAD